MKLNHRISKLIIIVAAMLALSAALGATCDPNGDDSTAEPPTPVAGVPTQSQTASPAPTPTPLPTATPTPAPLSGAEIFSRVSPNVPIVITGSGLGSGVLIPGGFIVTNAHVVWGYPKVLVKFPNSDAHRTLPVVGLDLMADIAVVGPARTALEGLPLQDGEDLASGSDVYLIGYPDEGDMTPDKPTITRGVISRFRQWRTLGLTLIQSDAVTAGGQSGGVMVSENGDVIGITTQTFGDGDFVIATSAEDIRERVNGLIEGEDVDGLADRRLPDSRVASQRRFKLTDRWDSKIAVLYEPPDTEIEIALESDTDSAFEVADIIGDLILEVDDTESGVEWGTTTLETFGPHFVRFSQFSSEPGEFALQASHDLHFIDDKDDHRRVSVNESVVGNVDAPFDEDYFELQLDAGESVTVKVESFMIDPYVRVARADWTRADVSDDDGGGGVVGDDAFLRFTAPESGTYIILVSDSWDRNVGGYFLKLDGAPRRSVSPPPTATPAPRPVSSPHGLMATYGNAEYGFSIQYPAHWLDSPITSQWEGDQSLFRGDDASLVIRIHDLPKQRLGDWTLDDYVDFWVSWIESDEVAGQIIANVEYGYIGGKPARLLTYTYNHTQSAHLFFVNERKIAYSAGYDLRSPPAEETIRMVEYSLGTFTVGGQRLTRITDVPEFPHDETDSPDSPAAAPDSAHEPLWFVPMATYRDEEHSLSVQYPADWGAYPLEYDDRVAFEGDHQEFFTVGIENLGQLGFVDWTLDEHFDWLVNHVESNANGGEVAQISDYGEIDGLPARVLFHARNEVEYHAAHLVFISKQQIAYNVKYEFPASLTDELAPMIEYSFRSIVVDGSPLTDTPDFPDLQNAFSSTTVPSTESARARGVFMPMVTYRNEEYPFTIQYSADWKAVDGGDPWVAQFSSYKGDDLALVFIDLPRAGLGDLPLDEQVDNLLSTIESEDIDQRIASTSRFGQIAGRPAHLIILIDRETDSLQVHFFYVDEGGAFYHVLFLLNTSNLADLLDNSTLVDRQRIVDYSLRSITIDGAPLTDAPELPSLDTLALEESQPSPESPFTPSPFGPMTTYRDDEFAFTMQYPAGWRADLDPGSLDASFSDYDGGGLGIAIGYGRNTEVSSMDTYSGSVIARYIATIDRAQVVSNSDYGRIDGRTARLIVLDAPTGTFVEFVYISEDSVIYTVVLIAVASRFDDLAPSFEYSLRSITINGKPLTNPPEFPRIE